ncbi:MAG: ADP-ribosylglycohydrolase family protein [Candidatus Eremiobacteraeota bacterium]|nr:ADP-ribosylglycohydrolase family protein [Candidatus Eremiobacteraeota bacterium]
MSSSQRDRFLGCILAGAVGDAAASPYEGLAEGSARAECSWELTDDTQLTLATCQALAGGRVEPEAIAAEMLRWYRERRIRRPGSSTLKALRDLDAGCHWALAGRRGEYAAGNGAAMRIAPLAFFLDPDSEKDRVLIRDVCRITHHNEEAYVGALAVVLAIRLAFGPRLPTGAEIAELLPDSVVRDRLRLPLESVGTTGYVADTVPRAIHLCARLPQLGIEGMLERVIADGGDADTIGSIACQVAGAHLGKSNLPESWWTRLPERDWVLQIASAVELPQQYPSL